jgi:hypothetical protein
VSVSAIVKFLRGDGRDHQGRSLDEIMEFSDEELEETHDYVQWLFPLPEPSRFNPCAPTLTEEDLELLQDPALRFSVCRGASRMMRFFADTSKWATPGDHNHLRITRILRCLTLVGLTDMAKSYYVCLIARVSEQWGQVLPEKTEWYWREALKKEPAWLG